MPVSQKRNLGCEYHDNLKETHTVSKKIEIRQGTKE